MNIEAALMKMIASVNSCRKPDCPTVVAKKSFQACFVRAGEKRGPSASKPTSRGLLASANDWKLLVDFEDRKIVFPPVICATSLRPDIVIWSMKSRTVILLELTCCAEEGIGAAQSRKETRYTDLLEQINSSNWNASLLTLEVGARLLDPELIAHSSTLEFLSRRPKSCAKCYLLLLPAVPMLST